MKATTKNIVTDNILVKLSDLTSEIQRRYDVEKNAKNKAYSFIIAMGMMDRFAQFCRDYHGIDHHEAAAGMLAAQAETQQ